MWKVRARLDQEAGMLPVGQGDADGRVVKRSRVKGDLPQGPKRIGKPMGRGDHEFGVRLIARSERSSRC